MRVSQIEWHESHHVITKIRGCCGVISQDGQGTRLGKHPAFFGLSLGIQDQSFLCISQRLIHIIASRETARKIGEPDSDGPFRTGIFDDGNIIGHFADTSVRLPTSLPIDITNEPASQVLLWMRQHNRPAGMRMLENVMRPRDALQNPSFRFKPAFDLVAAREHMKATLIPFVGLYLNLRHILI